MSDKKEKKQKAKEETKASSEAKSEPKQEETKKDTPQPKTAEKKAPESPWRQDREYAYAESKKLNINGMNLLVYRGQKTTYNKARKMHGLGVKIMDAKTGEIIKEG